MTGATNHRRRAATARHNATQARKPVRANQTTSAHIQLNRKITAAGERSEEDVLRIVHEQSAQMSLVNASTAWHCLARSVSEESASHESDPRLAQLAERTQELLLLHLQDIEGDPQPRCVATITWSCAKLKVQRPAIMSALGDLSIRWIADFKSFELVNVLWGFAKLQFQHAAFLQLAHDHIMRSTHLFSTRSLSMAAWAFATVRFRTSHNLLSKMTDAFVSGLAAGDDANPVTIANMIWALATTRAHVQRESLMAMSRAAASTLETFKAHELSVALWAFARLSACHECLFAKAAKLLCTNQRLCGEIHSQGIANLLWAFARNGLELQKSNARLFQDLLQVLLGTCLRLLQKLNSVEISSSVWAIAKLVPRWGQHPSADHILVKAAQNLLAEPQLLMGMSAHGASGVLLGYSEFFGEHGNQHMPMPCRKLIATLSQYCDPKGEMLDHGEHLGQEEVAVSLGSMTAKTAQQQDLKQHAQVMTAWLSLEPVWVEPRFTLPGAPPALQAGSEPAKVLLAGGSYVEALPSVAFLDEFGSDEDSEVTVSFEVDCAGRQDISAIRVETRCSSTQDDSFVFDVEEVSEYLSYTLKLPQQPSKWDITVSVLGGEGRTLGKSASASFPGSLMPKRLSIPNFASASTSAGTDPSTCSGSDSDRDPTTPTEQSQED